jgi:hypothetical protein
LHDKTILIAPNSKPVYTKALLEKLAATTKERFAEMRKLEACINPGKRNENAQLTLKIQQQMKMLLASAITTSLPARDLADFSEENADNYAADSVRYVYNSNVNSKAIAQISAGFIYFMRVST